MPKESAKIFSLLFAIGRKMRGDKGGKRKYSILHFQTLRYIKEKDQPLIHDVAGYLCVTPPAATLLVEGLVKDKLVSRSFDKKDRRAVRLALTGRGKTFLAGAIRERTGKLKQFFSVLTSKERAALIAILEKIAEKNN